MVCSNRGKMEERKKMRSRSGSEEKNEKILSLNC